MLKAIMFGAIGTLVETSELQRQAFNEAFAQEGLEWNWDEDLYRDLLEVSGGRNRIRHYAEERGDTLSEEEVASLHTRKTELYQQKLREGVQLRPGVARLIREALEEGVPLAFASTTSPKNIETIADAVGDALPLERFAAVMNAEEVENKKPEPDVYKRCLETLDIQADEAVAIEDTAISLQSAVNAGLVSVATPGQYTSEQDFSAADAVLEHLGDPDNAPEAIRSPAPLPEGGVSVAWLRELVERG